jgi:tetratricopeptide (TPR) repeat protein
MRVKTITRLLILSMITALAYQSPSAQSHKGSNRSGQKKALSQRDYDEQQNALQTLLYLRNNAFEIDSPPDRVRVLLEIADALWLIDKNESRDVFRQSFAHAAEFNDSAAETRSSTSPKELQQLVITRVARRDPALAKRLLLTSLPQDTQPSDGFAELYGGNAGRSEMLVKAAAETLATDTNQAVQMARLAVADGLSQQMRLFLLSLRARDRIAADAFFELALQTASSRRPKQLTEALFLWDYAFQPPTIYLGPVGWFREAPEYPVALNLKKRALGFAIDAVAENAAQFYFAAAPEAEKRLILERYALLQSVTTQILPDVERLMPSATENLLAQLSRLNQELREQGQKLPGPPEPLPKSSEVQGSVDKLLERAAKAANVATRDGLYAKAALRLYLHGEYERAIDVAHNIEDSSLRLELTEPIRFDWAGDLINRGELDAANNVAQTVETLDLRVTILARLAAACLEKKTPQGIAVLNEAEAAANKADPSAYLGSAMLAIARVYLKLNDRNQAKASTSTAIRFINAAEEGSGWDFLTSVNDRSPRLSVQDTQWTSREDGGLDSLTVVYPRITGLLDVLLEISDSNLNEGLLLARQLKRRGLNYATQAALCRRTIERVQQNSNSQKTNSARQGLE